MNYFELFEMPVSLQVNGDEISKKYVELREKSQPGFSSNAGDTDHEEIHEKYFMINNAFKIFQNADETLKYALQIKGLIEENENYQLPPDFLIMMAELNEGLADPDILSLEETATKVSHLETQLYQSVQNIIENYNAERTTNGQLLLVKEYYYKKNALNSISQRLEELRNDNSKI